MRKVCCMNVGEEVFLYGTSSNFGEDATTTPRCRGGDHNSAHHSPNM